MSLIKGLDREKVRSEAKVMIVDNVARTRWEARVSVRPTAAAPMPDGANGTHTPNTTDAAETLPSLPPSV